MEGVIFVAGIYGVGKSTLCEKLSKELKIPFYSSGDLISKVNGELYGANKVVKDKNKNQNILADAVHQIFLEYPSILLAGHFCIFNKNTEVDILPEEVFSELNIHKIILLEASEDIIINHLSKRDGKTYSVDQIAALKEAERAQALKVASELKKTLIIRKMSFCDSDVDEIITKIKEC